MKVTSVEIHPAGSSNVCVMSFRDPRRQNPYNVKGIQGLDADEIVPRFYGVSGDSNTKFYNMSREKRDIIALIELNPSFTEDETYSDLRDALYKLISTSRTGVVQIQFKNGTNVVAAISGFVTKFEASHFSKTPEVQLTISCDDPMLRALTPVVVDVGELLPVLTNIEDLLSTAHHGFTFDMEVVNDVASFNISDPDETWFFEVVPSGGFLDGDVLHFSSENNNKYLYLSRGATTIHLADVISPGSVWPILFPGDNEFVVLEDSDFSWSGISHYPTYWGV